MVSGGIVGASVETADTSPGPAGGSTGGSGALTGRISAKASAIFSF